ncbi:MAG: hypothetical protein US12_C0020G0012 [Parcubacteria group bacterium GW2011_GWA2_36_24]|nr:MAG: hypothetical protein US12_C0020G0012 [Parcubacteria group bacterium GW2011_GWA2_36_24]
MAFVAGLIATIVLVGCGTPRVGPAKTTLDPMPGVEQHLTYAKRVTTVTGDGPPTITLVEESRSKGQAQFELRDKELGGNTTAAVAQANRPVSWGTGYPTYGFSGGGVTFGFGTRVFMGGRPAHPYEGYICTPNPTRAVGAW